MMQEVLEEMPELQEDERTIVSTRVFDAPGRMVCKDLFERLTNCLVEKGVAA